MPFDPKKSFVTLEEGRDPSGFDPTKPFTLLQESPSLQPAIPAPGQTGPRMAPEAPVQILQAFPVQQSLPPQRQPAVQPLEAGAAVRQEPIGTEAEIQPFGEPGTFLHGASSVAAGILNRPEYMAAMLNPATAAAVGIYYAGPVAKQFVEDLGKATQGDNEALGRAAMIGVPALIGGARAGRSVAERLQAQDLLTKARDASSTAHIDALARSELTPRVAQAPSLLKRADSELAAIPGERTTDATQKGQIQEGVQPERAGTDAQRLPAKTGPGDRLQPETPQLQDQPQAPRPDDAGAKAPETPVSRDIGAGMAALTQPQEGAAMVQPRGMKGMLKPKPPPFVFAGRQVSEEGLFPPYNLWTLTEDVPNVGVKGSTVAEEALRKAGYNPSPPPQPKPSKVEVPETSPEAERDVPVLAEIRRDKLQTVEQIRERFPQLSREQARDLRNEAWLETKRPPAMGGSASFGRFTGVEEARGQEPAVSQPSVADVQAQREFELRRMRESTEWKDLRQKVTNEAKEAGVIFDDPYLDTAADIRMQRTLDASRSGKISAGKIGNEDLGAGGYIMQFNRPSHRLLPGLVSRQGRAGMFYGREEAAGREAPVSEPSVSDVQNQRALELRRQEHSVEWQELRQKYARWLTQNGLPVEKQLLDYYADERLANALQLAKSGHFSVGFVSPGGPVVHMARPPSRVRPIFPEREPPTQQGMFYGREEATGQEAPVERPSVADVKNQRELEARREQQQKQAVLKALDYEIESARRLPDGRVTVALYHHLIPHKGPFDYAISPLSAGLRDQLHRAGGTMTLTMDELKAKGLQLLTEEEWTPFRDPYKAMESRVLGKDMALEKQRALRAAEQARSEVEKVVAAAPVVRSLPYGAAIVKTGDNAFAIRDAQGVSVTTSFATAEAASKWFDKYAERLFGPPSGEEGPAFGFGLGAMRPDRALREFYEQDLKPALKAGVDVARAARGLFMRQLFPVEEAGFKGQKRGVDELFKGKGWAEMNVARTEAAFDALFDHVSKLPVTEQRQFFVRARAGTAQPTPELQQAAQMIRTGDQALQHAFNSARGMSPATGWLQHHAKVLWKKLPQNLRVSGSTPTWNDFLSDIADGMRNGGVPMTTNPVDLFLIHTQDVSKFVGLNRAWDGLKGTGTVTDVAAGTPPPPYFVRLPGRIMNTYLPASRAGAGKAKGEWYVQQDIANMINHYVSKDYIRENPAGRSMMWMKNATTAVELGLSPFHAVFESLETIGSSVGLGMTKMIRGGARRRSGMRDILTAAWSPITTAKLGGKAIRYFKDPASFRAADPDGYDWFVRNYPRAYELIRDGFDGGMQLKMNDDWRFRLSQSFTQAIKGDNPIGAALFHAIPSLNRLAMKPLFETYIPRLKVGMWLREYSFELQRNVDALSNGQITRPELARRTWAFIEDRFGEMNFDNLYWDRTFKSAMQFATRSVTWKLGNIRGFGKAVLDTSQATGDIARLKWAHATLPMGWMVGMAVTTSVLASIISKVTTGKFPWDMAKNSDDLLRNLAFPRISATDNTQRLSVPTYLRDAVHLVRGPVSYIKSSMTGEINRAIDVWNNRDFYGTEVYHPDDPLEQKAWDVITHLIPMPFGLSSYEAAKRSGATPGQRLWGFGGFTKAPFYMSYTPGEAKALELMRSRLPQGSRTREAFETSIKERQAAEAIKRGDMTPTEAVREGLVKANRVEALRQRTKETLLAHVVRRLDADQSMMLYRAASKDEKNEIRARVREKVLNSRTLTPEKRRLYREQLME